MPDPDYNVDLAEVQKKLLVEGVKAREAVGAKTGDGKNGDKSKK